MRRWIAWAVSGAILFGAADAHAAVPKPLGLACAPADGVRFCPGNGTTDRTPSFDGVPLDADVTLPATGVGPWPTIVLLNGLGGQTRQFEPTAPQPGPGRAPKILIDPTHHDNVWFASRGYAVLAYSSRGFGGSCGAGGAPAAQLQAPPCSRGFVRLGDQRYDSRDTQYLLGLLADEGVAIPDRLAATGFSYGGGQAVTLGYLRDKLRCGAVVPAGDPCAGRPNGSYVPWRSPKGTPLRFAAIYGQWLWSDLLSALLPNGRYLDFDPATVGASLQPLGVEIQSYANALFALAQLDGYVVTPQAPGSADAEWDLATAVATFGAGEPYGAQALSIARAFQTYHGGFGVPGPHAPMLLESAWNDDVFPPAESLRAYADLRAQDPHADVALLLGDYGHGRAANKPVAARAFNDAASAFFDEHLRGVGHGPAPGSVTAYLSTCPSGAGGPADDGPLVAPNWAALHRDTATIRGAGPQTISSSGGDPTIGYQFDPIPNTNPLGTPDPCKTVPASRAAGTAVYELPVTAPLTMLGLPTIRAQITSTGSGGEIAGRLWDVSPAGAQRLVNRGVYRLTDGQSGAVVFQLHGNGYRFAAGHTVKLELAPSDAPQFRASNGTFTVDVRSLTADLPLATPCVPTITVTLPKVRGALRATVTLDGRRLARVGAKALRRRRLVLRDLPVGRARLRVTIRARTPGARRTHLVRRTLAVRVCVE
jgi:dienelactone hydrolase